MPSVAMDSASHGALARSRHRKKITTTAMVITAIPPTTPTTMKPVFGLLLPEGEAGEGVAVGLGEVLVAGRAVEVLVAERAVEVLEALINTPGDISGLST